MRFFLVAVALAPMCACGGSAFTAAQEAGDGGGDAGGVTGDAGDAASTDAAADAPSSIDAGAEGGAACAALPGLFGRYGMINAMGSCNDIDTNAGQCITATARMCEARFESTPPANANPAVNGLAQLQPDGTFTGASLTLGTVLRANCSGAWTPSAAGTAATMKLTCGTTSGCTVTMTRTGPCL